MCVLVWPMPSSERKEETMQVLNFSPRKQGNWILCVKGEPQRRFLFGKFQNVLL
jgi:hypothetical protein